MVDVLSKTNLFSCNNIITQQHKTNQDAKSSRLYGFPLKVRLQHASLRLQKSGFHGKSFVLQGNQGRPIKSGPVGSSINAKAGLIGNAQKWWEKGLQPNMKEIASAQDLVDSLLNSGDKLVVVDFFSPGCGGCKALHPKICQFAEMNPDVQFLQVNYEEHKSMCYSLNVHVLPFFRFYRGAHGRLCSFSCTNATIKKFKDALSKHITDRCSLGLTKGLEEKELLALSANKDLNFTYTAKPPQPEHVPAQEGSLPPKSPSQTTPSPLHTTIFNSEEKERTLVASGR